MSARRSLSWSAALRDMRADRLPVPAGLIGIRYLIETYTRTRKRPLVVAGKFDRSAIMALAAAAAKQHQARTGSTWAVAMSVSLQAAWQVAHAARRAAAH